MYRRSLHPDAVGHVPNVLAVWVTFAGRRDGKTEAQIDETRLTIDEDLKDHLRLMRARE